MIIKIAKLYLPEYIKKRKLDDLFRITADAFECDIPEMKRLSFAERLHAYAVFTQEQAEKFLRSGDSPEERKAKIDAVEEKLYRHLFHLGQDLRKSLHIRTSKQAIEALELIYRMIGIDFRVESRSGSKNGRPACAENGPDEFTIKECYFSKYYSAEVCGLISSLDMGLTAGLTGGGRLVFSQRITEGCECCRGYLTFS